jgi:hypothetical protein
MSILNRIQIDCQTCGAEAPGDLVASVNADRRPDLRQGILDRSFQAVPCPVCRTPMRLPPRFTYMDIGRGQWILAHAAPEIADWQEREQRAQDIFDHAFGAAASTPARGIGRGLSPRITFGWPALREKLICREAGLDDVSLELLKAALLCAVSDVPFRDDSELRLDAVEANELAFHWLAASSEASLATLRVPRSAYDAIADGTDDWADLRTTLAAGLLVDLQRLLAA